jgi:HAE1 family hydrophobic/amphiphilic exporter-1
MAGIIGRFFFQFGITVGFAVLVSLYVSLRSTHAVVPLVRSGGGPERSADGSAAAEMERQVDRLQNIMAATLGWSLSHRWAVMVLATVAVFPVS